MKPSRHHLLFAAIVLLCAGVWVLRPDIARSTNAADAEKGITSRMRTHERQLPTAPIDRLRALTKTPISRAPSFDTVDLWATGLTDSELRKLIGETGMEEDKDLAGWLRCALFAEWGRRDPDAALSYLRGFEFHNGKYAVDQSWFSVFRGWASNYPDAALAGLREFEAKIPLSHREGRIDRPESYMIHYATRAIFAELAANDPEHAWQLAQGSLKEPGVIDGIVRGAASSPALQSMLDQWVEQNWKSPETQQALEKMKRQAESSISGEIPIPPNLQVAESVALALGNTDFERGEAWIHSLGNAGWGVSGNLLDYYRNWATNHPDEAMTRLELDPKRESNKSIASGLLAADPSLGSQVMALMPDDRSRGDLASQCFTTCASYYLTDYFPAPGQRNPLHDFETVYHQVLESVAAAKLPAAHETRVLEDVNREFSSKVPAAADAFKNVSRKD